MDEAIHQWVSPTANIKPYQFPEISINPQFLNEEDGDQLVIHLSDGSFGYGYRYRNIVDIKLNCIRSFDILTPHVFRHIDEYRSNCLVLPYRAQRLVNDCDQFLIADDEGNHHKHDGTIVPPRMKLFFVLTSECHFYSYIVDEPNFSQVVATTDHIYALSPTGEVSSFRWADVPVVKDEITGHQHIKLNGPSIIINTRGRQLQASETTIAIHQINGLVEIHRDAVSYITLNEDRFVEVWQPAAHFILSNIDQLALGKFSFRYLRQNQLYDENGLITEFRTKKVLRLARDSFNEEYFMVIA